MAQWAAAAVAAYGAKEDRDDRKDQEKEADELKAEQDKQYKEEQTEKFAAKKREYTTQREVLRRGKQRGRMSTILDKDSSLG